MEASPQTPPLRSPLRARRGLRELYPYYAGYSEEFVEDVLAGFNLRAGSVVMDPWNGAGTTTAVARRRGYRALGIDVNPAMVIVARGRLLDRGEGPDLLQAAIDVAHRAVRDTIPIEPDEPLVDWLHESAAVKVRRIATIIGSYESGQIEEASPSTSFLMVALFRTVRSLLGSRKTSNPTWLRSAKDEGGASNAEVVARFVSEVREMIVALPESGEGSGSARIVVGDSSVATLSQAPVNCVITSPPYCTRIDYAVATKPELAVLGYREKDFRSLRLKMLGTTASRRAAEIDLDEVGAECRTFLARVEAHPSKDSAGYYLKHYRQYFSQAHETMVGITRVAASDAKLCLVVRNSFYKEVPVNLATIYAQMAGRLGWRLSEQLEFPIQSNLRDINTRARRHLAAGTVAETALLFDKAEEKNA